MACLKLTIRERLAVLNPGDPDDYFDKFDFVPGSLPPGLAKGRVRVTNRHAFNSEAEDIRVGGVAVGRLGPETADSFARNCLNVLWDEEPILVLNDEGHHAYRPIASTASVRFKPVKPVQPNSASHLNFAAADTNSWEQAAASQLELLAKQGDVICYARNHRLELNVTHEFYGQPRV